VTQGTEPHADWADEAQVQDGPRAGSVVQSVRFARDEITRVRSAAKHAGVSTSEYIRDAAIARAVGSAFYSVTIASEGTRFGHPETRTTSMVNQPALKRLAPV
jgi:hypothetical protein